MENYKFRYEYRFDYGSMGIRVQFVKDFQSVDQLQTLANCPHVHRRSWAASLVANYRNLGSVKLNSHDFNAIYGQIVREHFPNGAVLNFVEPSQSGQDLILIIQVSFILVKIDRECLIFDGLTPCFNR